mgnify:CR=1 FL=1
MRDIKIQTSKDIKDVLSNLKVSVGETYSVKLPINVNLFILSTVLFKIENIGRSIAIRVNGSANTVAWLTVDETNAINKLISAIDNIVIKVIVKYERKFSVIL